jgi:hypothetical protein
VNKPQSLRNALNKSVAYVRDNPDKLHLLLITVRWSQPAPFNVMGISLHPERGD